MTRRPCRCIVFLLLTAACALSCGGGRGSDGVTSPPSSSFKPVLSWVKVSVSPVVVEIGKTATATAEAFDQSGGPFNAGSFTFTSSAPTVATVDASGTVRGVVAGAVTVTAAVGGKEASRDITVVPVFVSRVVVSPVLLNLDPGDSATLVATLYDASGAVLVGRTVTWTSSDTTAVVVTTAGRVTARRAGRAKISATNGERSDAAVVNVTGTVAAAGDLVISFAVPAPGAIVGDSLEVFANVSSSQPLARVEASFQGTTLRLVLKPVPPKGGLFWYGLFEIATVRFGKYYVLVTATDMRNATATDSVLFERNPRLKGGGAAGPGRTNKLVAPTVVPTVTRRRPRGHLTGNP